MSSIFEAPPSRRRGSWLKIVPAFLAGALVAFAVSQLPMILYGTPQPTVSSRVPPSGDRQPSESRSEAPKAAVAERSRTLPDASQNAPAPPAEGHSSPMQAAPAPTASSAEGKGCTWPYVDQRCAESDTNSGHAAGEQPTQSVRVIPTDRSAPTTLEATTGPSTTTVSKPSASSESNQTGNVAAAGSTSTSSAAAPARSAARSVTQPPSAPKRAAEPLPPSAPKRAAEPLPNGASRVREPASSKEVRQASTRQKEAKRAKASEQQARTARSHRTYERYDDAASDRYDDAASRLEFDDSAVARTHVLPDGRRLTVYRTLNPRDEVRTVARGETYRVRRAPLVPSSADADDDDDY